MQASAPLLYTSYTPPYDNEPIRRIQLLPIRTLEKLSAIRDKVTSGFSNTLRFTASFSLESDYLLPCKLL